MVYVCSVLFRFGRDSMRTTLPATRSKPIDHLKPRELASIAVAAERYDVNPRTIRRRIADGTLTGYRIGRIIKVDLLEADEVMLRPIPTVGGGRLG